MTAASIPSSQLAVSTRVLGLVALLALATVSTVLVVSERCLLRNEHATLNYVADDAANLAAGQMAQKVMPALAHWSTYAKVRIVDSGVEIDMVGSPPAGVRQLVAENRTLFDGRAIPVSYRPVPYSERTMKNEISKIASDASYWRRHGVQLSFAGIAYGSDRVLIRLSHYTLTAARALRTHYGDLVAVYPHDWVFRPETRDRLDDYAPWLGGDRIHIAGLTDCTLWFPAYSTLTGGSYNLTAGHCVAQLTDQNKTAWIYQYNSYSTAEGSVDPGHVRYTPGGETDAAIWHVSSNYVKIWADPGVPPTPWSAGTRVVMNQAASDPLGVKVCAGGSFTGEVCNVQIKETGQVFTPRPICDQVIAVQLDGLRAVQGGDSGGPVYAGEDGSYGAEAFGMLVGGSTARTPGDTIIYTPVRDVLRAWPNLALRTSP